MGDYAGKDKVDEARRALNAIKDLSTPEGVLAYGYAQLDLIYRRAEVVSRAGWSSRPEHQLTDKQKHDVLHDVLGGLASMRSTLSLLEKRIAEAAPETTPQTESKGSDA